MEKNKLLEARKKAKRKMPLFVVKESNGVGCVKRRWRYPRGRHSPVRQRHRGRTPIPSPGYGSPKAVFGLHTSGLLPVVVCNEKELLALDKRKEGAVLSSNLGNRKRLALLKLSQEKGFPLLNVKDNNALIQKIGTDYEERRKEKGLRLAGKTKREEERKKKAEEKKKEEEKKNKETLSVEDKLKKEETKKDEEKEIAEKVMTKKQ